MEPHLKRNKIILVAHVGIFMRQSWCSQITAFVESRDILR